MAKKNSNWPRIVKVGHASVTVYRMAHAGGDSLLSWNTVPAVTETSLRQAKHRHKSRLISSDLLTPHRGQTKPSGHRSAVRYSLQTPSLLNRRSSSSMVCG